VNVPSPENVRQIKLDIIQSDLVESVEINKTLLASGDGDAIGGSVNLRTKSAGERPTLSLYGLGGYTPIVGGRGEDSSAPPSANALARRRVSAFCSAALTTITAGALTTSSPRRRLPRWWMADPCSRPTAEPTFANIAMNAPALVSAALSTISSRTFPTFTSAACTRTSITLGSVMFTARL